MFPLFRLAELLMNTVLVPAVPSWVTDVLPRKRTLPPAPHDYNSCMSVYSIRNCVQYLCGRTHLGTVTTYEKTKSGEEV